MRSVKGEAEVESCELFCEAQAGGIGVKSWGRASAGGGSALAVFGSDGVSRAEPRLTGAVITFEISTQVVLSLVFVA